ncbi:MAG: right-handed parallel beta-helix repeat-containing protein [Saprospiraceae bacterium]
MKKQKIAQPMCATERVSILTTFFNLKSICLAMMLLLSYTSIAQNLQKRPQLLPGQCADLSIDREKTTITPAGNFIPGCTPITYVVRICNYGNCAASGVPIEFRLPKEFILTNPDAFKFIRNDITGDKVYGTSVNFPPIDPLTGEACVEFRFEGKLDKNADPDTKYGFYTTFEFTEKGTLYRDANRSWLTPPNGLIKIQGDARNIPILNNSNAGSFGSVVYIDGDLDFYPTIPSSNTRLFWLQNYDISVAPNVKLTVNAQAKLNIVNSNIHGCDQMWDGIVVKSGAELETLKYTPNENTEIHDAKKAILATGNALVDCRDTKFIDNYIGVSLENAHEVFVHKNTSFTGTGKLLPAVGINVGKIPYAGITASNNSVLVAVGSEFSNLANGIMGKNSIIALRDNVFKDIKKTDAYASSGQGIAVNNGSSKRDLKISNCSFANIEEVAIRASKADVEVTGGKNAKIANTPVGIIVTKTDKLTVDGIKFDAADQGISAVLNHDLRMNIHSNEFKNGNTTGINLRFNTFPEKGVISSNKMDLQGRAAILSEYPTYGQGFSIENNPEIYFSGKNAIHISEGQNVIVQKNNDIWFKNGDHAVNWEGGSNNTTYCNSIRTDLNTNSGLRVEMSFQPVLSCNTVNYKYEKTGVRFDGVSMFTDFAANTMTTSTPNPAIAGLGLRLNENAVIGGQKYQGNVFEQSGAMNLNPDYYSSRFTVWDGGLQNYLPKFVSPQFWFNRNIPAPVNFKSNALQKELPAH